MVNPLLSREVVHQITPPVTVPTVETPTWLVSLGVTSATTSSDEIRRATVFRAGWSRLVCPPLLRTFSRNTLLPSDTRFEEVKIRGIATTCAVYLL